MILETQSNYATTQICLKSINRQRDIFEQYHFRNASFICSLWARCWMLFCFARGSVTPSLPPSPALCPLVPAPAPLQSPAILLSVRHVVKSSPDHADALSSGQQMNPRAAPSLVNVPELWADIGCSSQAHSSYLLVLLSQSPSLPLLV